MVGQKLHGSAAATIRWGEGTPRVGPSGQDAARWVKSATDGRGRDGKKEFHGGD